MTASSTVQASIASDVVLEAPIVYRIPRELSGAYRMFLAIPLFLLPFALFDWFFLIAPLLLLLAIFGFIYVEGYDKIRLNLTKNGLEYRGFGYVTRSTWANLERIGEFGVGDSAFRGIILHKPHYETVPWMAALEMIQFPVAIGSAVAGNRVHSSALHSYGWVIPVGQFEQEWETGEIGGLIRRNAPQVFETGERPALIYNRQ